MKIIASEYFRVESEIGNKGASGIGFPDGFKKMDGLFFGGQKFDLESQFHKMDKDNKSDNQNCKKEVVLLPASRAQGFRTKFL